MDPDIKLVCTLNQDHYQISIDFFPDLDCRLIEGNSGSATRVVSYETIELPSSVPISAHGSLIRWLNDSLIARR